MTTQHDTEPAAQTDTEPAAPPAAQASPETTRQRRDPQVTIALISTTGLIMAAVIGGISGFATGWLQLGKPDKAAPASTPTPSATSFANSQSTSIQPSITSPIDGESVDRCTSVRGVAPPPSGDEGVYWIVIRSPNLHHYLMRRLMPSDGRPTLWNPEKINIGAEGEIGYSFELFLARTNGSLTREFASRAQSNDPSRWDLGTQLDASVAHKVTVRRTAGPGC